MLQPGDHLGPYEIRGLLGEGGMGHVYRAFDPRLERTVALKVILVPASPPPSELAAPSSYDTPDFSQRLLREARAVASLSHPNVVGIYDVGESSGCLYLAMEYVVGSTLRSLVGQDEVPLARKVRWLVDVARALEAAHRAGLVHRDVKPENVMVRDDGVVKVLDFGIARRTLAADTDDQRAIDTVTGQGSIAGTPVYMAPEQIKGEPVDARSDQFAFGVLAYELLCGERPWPSSGDILSVVAKILTEPAPLDRLRTRAPSALVEVIGRCLEKDPRARFASMQLVADALEPFATTSSDGAPRVRVTSPVSRDAQAFATTTRVPTSSSLRPPEAPTFPAPKARRAWDALRLAVPLVLIGALAGGVLVVRKRTRPPVTTPTTTTTAPRPLSSVPEAETAYKDAMRLWKDGSTAKMRAALARAVELDPTFAAAHLQTALAAQEVDPALAQAAFQEAFDHREMLLPRDALLLEASEPFIRPRPDLDEWETRLSSAVFQYPRDPELQLYLGDARMKRGDDEGAAQAYETALKLDPAFVPAIAALAEAMRNLGKVAEALATTERCFKQSPVASVCVETRYHLLFDAGQCHGAREAASQWRTLEPQSADAAAAFARALHADGAPLPSVEETLARSWELLPESRRSLAELRDRMRLAIVRGDLAKADELAREYDERLPKDASQSDHALPARVRMNTLLESGDLDGAVAVAHGFLDRKDAWPAYAFASDPSIDFYEPLRRKGELEDAALADRRRQWMAREKVRLPGGDQGSARVAWNSWSSVWGGFAETREEALAAIAKMPKTPVPQGARRTLSVDFTVGKVYALAGKPDLALPSLTRVTGTCSSLDDAMVVLRGRYYQGLSLEAKGDRGHAKQAYRQVLETWPNTTTSRTVKAAQRRLATL